MGLKISGRLFYGPSPVDQVVVKRNHSPAVFAIVSRSGESWNPTFRLLDVGYSGTEGMVLSENPNVKQWELDNDGELQVYLIDLKRKDGDPAERAQAIIDEYRERYHPPKGFISLAE
jgi:hypothetical protein